MEHLSNFSLDTDMRTQDQSTLFVYTLNIVLK